MEVLRYNRVFFLTKNKQNKLKIRFSFNFIELGRNIIFNEIQKKVSKQSTFFVTYHTNELNMPCFCVC